MAKHKGRGPGPAAGVAEGLKAASAHYRAGRADAAVRAYRSVLAADPGQPDALYALGVLALQAGRNEEALDFLERRARVPPPSPPAANTRGLALTRLGRGEAAEAAFRDAVTRDPAFAEAWANLGGALEDRGDLDGAEAALRRAVGLNPRLPFALNNLGMLLVARARPEEAVKAYAAALQLVPDNPVLHNNLGNARLALGDGEGAVNSLNRALALDPNYAEARLNLGHALAAVGRLDEAAAAYAQTVADKPDLAEAHFHLGCILRDLRREDEAVASLRRALALRPDNGRDLGFLIQTEKRRCEWDQLPPLEEAARDNIRRRAGTLPPLVALGLEGVTLEDQLACARGFVEDVCGPYMARALPPVPTVPAVPPGPREAGAPLTVGYLSADFDAHPVGRLMAGILEAHDRSNVRVLGYALRPSDGSDLRARLERACDGFTDLNAASEVDAARRIRADGVEVLVDLGGHTRASRIPILALRPAPVQVAYLGYPGTTGAPFIDYLVADRFVLHPEDAPFYAEQPVWLPGCFMAADGTEPAPPPGRAAAGLPETGFVFCGFNRPEKIGAAWFARWLRLLAAVPDSALWLSPAGERAVANLRRAAEGAGVDPERLVFAKRVAGDADHLARIAHADLFLDTLPYNAHATAVDALRVGVPVLTTPGPTFAGRVAGSLLTALDLPELVAPDPDAYEATAVALAADPEALASLRARLAARRGGPPFDPKAVARHLEAAFAEMARRRAVGESPAPIDLA